MHRNPRTAKAALIVVGILGIALGLFGAWYNIVFGMRFFPNTLNSLRARGLAVPLGFVPVFWMMSTVSLTCNVVVTACGVQYVRLRSNLDRLFAGVAAFEVAYTAAVYVAARLPRIGPAVSAALGIANGALVPQVILLFPVWAPFLAIWAGRRLKAPEAAAVG